MALEDTGNKTGLRRPSTIAVTIGESGEFPMTRQLTPEHETLVERILAVGEHDDPDLIIEEALRLYEERERKLKWLRAELAIAEEQVQRGELIDFTREHLDELAQRAIDNARQGKPIRDAVRP